MRKPDLETRVYLWTVLACGLMVNVVTGLAGEKILSAMFGSSAVYAAWLLLGKKYE